jgi:hypothetical protein
MNGAENISMKVAHTYPDGHHSQNESVSIASLPLMTGNHGKNESVFISDPTGSSSRNESAETKCCVVGIKLSQKSTRGSKKPLDTVR